MMAELKELMDKLSDIQGESPLILPSVGAQVVASVVADWTGVNRFIDSGSLISPNPKHHGVYDERFAHYRELYERLSPLFLKMAKDKVYSKE